MRRPISIVISVLLMIQAGCSSTGGTRLGARTGSRSIAVVGDRPMPATSGEPGSQVATEAPDPEPRRNSKARISGRVVDDQGRPAPGITVRLADGGTKGGRDIRATTDRSGAFTLNGLRPGSSYSLVAESEDDRGRLTGRAEAEASETGVEISLTGTEETGPARPQAGRALRAKPISSREESVPAADDEGSRTINREDLRPADEADDPDLDRKPAASRPRLSPPEPTVGWRKKGATTGPSDPAGADVESVASSATEETAARPRRSAANEAEPEEDEVNPLPPAINRKRGAPAEADDTEPQPAPRPASRRKAGDRAIPKPDDLGSMSMVPEADEAPPQVPGGAVSSPRSRAVASGLPEMPTTSSGISEAPGQVEVAAGSGLVPGPHGAGQSASPTAVAQGLVPDADPPPPSGAEPPGLTPSPPSVAAVAHVESPPLPASEPVIASTASKADAAPTPPAGQDYNPFLLASATRTVTAAPVEKAAGPPPAAEAEDAAGPPRKKWGELATAERTDVSPEPTKSTASLMKRIRGSAERKDVSLSLCSYDSRLRKIVDFRLPDLQGKPVRFQDIDADFILLDFWGSWCGPCLDSIPHLVALQKEYGPKRLRVVGIACEQVPPAQRKAKVEEASRRLGINYAILLSGMDGKPCPVQEQLQVQYYPTTILVDRTGRILWRNAGATPATQERLDRVLAGLSRGDTVRR